MNSRRLSYLLYLLLLVIIISLTDRLLLMKIDDLIQLNGDVNDLRRNDIALAAEQLDSEQLNLRIDSLSLRLDDEKARYAAKHSAIFSQISEIAAEAEVKILTISNDKNKKEDIFRIDPSGKFTDICRFIHRIETEIPALCIDEVSFSLNEGEINVKIDINIIKLIGEEE
ncbi:MAG: hypothetical protein PHR06_05175 [Candidatus Cloacimonetes bacterium]|nr:hypothetical protein [Candidatus Cloacimonadota bacterium]